MALRPRCFADLRSCRAVPDNARTARPANRLSLDLAFYRDYTRDALHLLPSLETCLVRLTAEYLHHSALVSDLSQTAKRIKLEYERPPFELFYSRIEAKSPTVAILVASSRYEIGAPPLILRHNERDKGGTTYQLPRNEIDYQQHAALPSPKYEYFPDLVIPASGNCLVAAATPHIVQYPPAAKVAIERCELIHRAVFLLRSFWFLTSFDSLPTLLARTETFILSLPTSDAHGYAEIVSHPERFTPETIPLPGVPGGCIDARGRDTIAAPVEEEERERNDSEEGEEDGSEDADKRSDLFRTTARQSGVRIRW
ncbi:hypothetical protein JCM10207_004037 [Rhodosporidiobolus poonsookiae]